MADRIPARRSRRKRSKRRSLRVLTSASSTRRKSAAIRSRDLPAMARRGRMRTGPRMSTISASSRSERRCGATLVDAFIEVIGQGTLTETVVVYRADLSVAVRAAKDDAALKAATELRSRCIRTLKESGIKSSELTEGGGQVWRPWFWKKKPGQEVSHKILIAC